MLSPKNNPQANADTIQHYLTLMDHCLSTLNLPLTSAIHSLLLKSSLTSHTLLSNRLTHLYSKLNSLPSAYQSFIDLPSPNKNLHSYNTILSALASRHLTSAIHLFDQMPQRNLVSYNTLISALTHHGHHSRALRIFNQMRRDMESRYFDRFTVVAAGSACLALGDLKSLRTLHGCVVLSGMEVNLIMGNVFVDGYGKCGDVGSARRVFDGMGERDVVSWTSLIGGYCRGGLVEEARRVFDEMPVKNVVSWTALVSGHEQNGEEERAVEVFEEMVEEGFRPTAFTLVSVLSAFARLGLIARGKEVHGYVFRTNSFNVISCNALIDMYSKCGDMESASLVFDSMTEHDVVSWNSLITGFAQNGLGNRSLDVFKKMVEAGVKPTHVTFLGLLSACSHAGLVSEGRRFLNLMAKEYGVCPSSEHYAAFIDALGRKKQLKEAAELIETLPSINVTVWGALLGACQVHGELELGKRAAEFLFDMEPENSSRYVTLSNIYAASGKWDEAKRIRLVMKKKGLRKEAGYSWIEVRSAKHVFGAADKLHCQTEEIYGMLDALIDQMMEKRTDLLIVHGEGI